MNDLIHNNEMFIKIITNNIKNECNLKKIIKMNNKWNKDYKEQDWGVEKVLYLKRYYFFM